MQEETKQAEVDKVQSTLRSAAINKVPEGWKSMESLGFETKDKDSTDELFEYARSPERQQHIYYNNTENKFVEDTKSSNGLYFNTSTGLLEYKSAKYYNSEIYVNVEEYMQFNLVPVTPLKEDKGKESPKNPPEGFQILRSFSNYAGWAYDSTEKAEQDLFKFIEAKRNRVTVFVLEPDIGTGYIFSTPVWFPVTAIREKFGNTPFFLKYTRSDGKVFLRGGNSENPLTLYQIAVNKALYNDFLNTRGSIIVEVDGEQVEVASSGQRAKENNTVKGMFIKSKNSLTVYEILRKNKKTWTVRNTESNKESDAKFKNKYFITDKPTEESSEDEIEDGGTGELSVSDDEDNDFDDLPPAGVGSVPADRTRSKTTKPKMPRQQPLRVVSYEGVAGEVPALPLLRIPEPHEL